MSYVSVAHQSLVATTTAFWRVSMNLKALSTAPGDKAALFVCGALHPATKAFHMLLTLSFSLSSLAIALPPSKFYLNTFSHLTLGIKEMISSVFVLLSLQRACHGLNIFQMSFSSV